MLGSFRSNVTVPLRRPNIMGRRELLGMLGAAGFVAVIDSKGHAQHEGHGGKAYDDCLEACEACERSCNETFHHCYTQLAAGKTEYAKSLHLVAGCARFCDLSADLIAGQSSLMVHACLACAEACRACAAECDKLDSVGMKSCVKACRECETTCRAMVKAMGHDHHG
jgi:hypothetical protein